MQPRDISVYPFDPADVATRRGRLPHWEAPQGIYFVTFRLIDSVPDEVLRGYLREQEELTSALLKASPEETAMIQRDLVRLYCARIDRCL
ncbi:MAG TPA: hypothetical protein VGE01_05915, partial [Fimbriimonas sp.]